MENLTPSTFSPLFLDSAYSTQIRTSEAAVFITPEKDWGRSHTKGVIVQFELKIQHFQAHTGRAAEVRPC